MNQAKMVNLKTPEQRRAADARNALPLEKDEIFKKKYRAYAERLGPAILINGLGQALASELAAAGNAPDQPHRQLYQNLQAWLITAKICEGPDLLEAIIAGDQRRYLRAQSEALAWLTWHKKLCQAYLPKPDSEE